MKILVLGVSKSQLDNWRNRHFTQGMIYRASTGVIVDGDKEYIMWIARPNDERAIGMEFHTIVLLDGAIDYGGQYSMRVRLHRSMR